MFALHMTRFIIMIVFPCSEDRSIPFKSSWHEVKSSLVARSWESICKSRRRKRDGES